MNDPMLAVSALDRIIDALEDPQSLSVPELSGLFAAARLIKSDLDAYIKRRGGHPYAREKAHEALWHIGALTGFDVTNGHDAGQHRVWALTAASSLRGVLSEMVEADPDR